MPPSCFFKGFTHCVLGIHNKYVYIREEVRIFFGFQKIFRAQLGISCIYEFFYPFLQLKKLYILRDDLQYAS